MGLKSLIIKWKFWVWNHLYPSYLKQNIQNQNNLSLNQIKKVEVSQPKSSGSCGLSLTYSIEDESLIISGSGDMSNYTIRGYNIIAPPWYSYHTTIKTVVLPDGIASIGSFAFFNFSILSQITILNSATWIGESAFNNCTELLAIC